MSKFTDAEKVKIYEDLFHRINAAAIGCRNDMIREYVGRIINWSYAHRHGNGEPTDEEQQAMIDLATEKMLDRVVVK